MRKSKTPEPNPDSGPLPKPPGTPIIQPRQTRDLTAMPLRASVLTLAIPAVIRGALQSVIGMVSLMVVGVLGPEAIAAVGVGNRIMLIFVVILQALSVGATALVARYIGAKDFRGAQEVVNQAVALSFVVGSAIALIGIFFAEPIMRGMLSLQEVPDPVVLEMGTTYLQILSSSYVIAVLLFMANAIFQGAGDMRTPLFIMTYVNVINLIGAYVLVIGVGPIPSLGITGAALAAGFARASGALIALWILAGNRGIIGMKRGQGFSLQLPIVRSILRVGGPAALENGVRRGSQVLYTILIAGMGTAPMAANSIALNVQSLGFEPGFGFGLAATALVGQNLGARNPKRAQEAGQESFRMGLLVSLVISAIFLLVPGPLARLYTNDPETIRLTVICLRIVAISQPFLSMVMVYSGGLRGAGDTTFVLYSSIIGTWGIRLVGAYYLGIHLGYGLVGVWFSMAVDHFVQGLILLRRFRLGRWKTIKL